MSLDINSNIDQSKLNVLIVDDIPLNVILIQKMLSSRFKFHLLSANDGKTALDLIEAGGINLVLLDLMMPGIDGYEVLRRLREDSKTQKLPVVILSALNSNDDIKKGMDMGANDFISKPIIMERLYTSIAKQINAVAV